MRVVLPIVAMLFSTTCTAAPSTEVTAPFSCNYDGNQQQMNACAIRDYKAADVHMNEQYKTVIASLAPAKQAALRQRQRAWLKHGDLQCRTEAKPSEGGSIWELEYFSCLKSATELRTKDIEHWVAQP
jgi:uncharacterized protein YecT (DUF1311 family)